MNKSKCHCCFGYENRHLFVLLQNGTFDYASLGVNEVEQIFQHRALPLGGISIEPSLMLYYPFPLVFYVNPKLPSLAERVSTGLNRIINNGMFETLFNEHYGQVVQRLNLRYRRTFTLNNPRLPTDMLNFKATLLDES